VSFFSNHKRKRRVKAKALLDGTFALRDDDLLRQHPQSVYDQLLGTLRAAPSQRPGVGVLRDALVTYLESLDAAAVCDDVEEGVEPVVAEELAGQPVEVPQEGIGGALEPVQELEPEPAQALEQEGGGEDEEVGVVELVGGPALWVPLLQQQVEANGDEMEPLMPVVVKQPQQHKAFAWKRMPPPWESTLWRVARQVLSWSWRRGPQGVTTPLGAKMVGGQPLMWGRPTRVGARRDVCEWFVGQMYM
jgi:hypothetical protein